MKCPACGKGRIFSGIVEIAVSCDNCGLEFAGHDIGDGPVYFLVVVLSVIITALALWVEFGYSPPFWLHILLWPPLVMVATVAGLRFSKAMLLTKQYQHRRKNFEERL